MCILREVYAELALAYCDLIVLSLNSFASWSCLVNGAVVDHRLHPWCCHLGGYFKHTLLFCRYLCRDIMCKHDVIKIQHVHCGLVGPNCKKKSRASTACNRYSYVPSPRLRTCEPDYLYLVATSSSSWLTCKYDVVHKPEIRNISPCH